MTPAIVSSFRRSFCAIVGLSLAGTTLEAQADSVTLSPNYWQRFGYGVTTSILVHEMAHLVASIALGGHPTFGFDKARPTVYSGINSRLEPHKQFLFSAAGLTLQSLIDEAILDIPHKGGGAFERGMLGGGIGTTVFYLTIGRKGSVSDVDFMARTRAMTATQITLIFSAIVAVHTFRISRDSRYANFFARPRADAGVEVGMNLRLP